MINSVHDEIIIEVPRRMHSQELMRDIIWVMQMDSPLVGAPVPLPVEIKIAPKRWSHTHKVLKADGTPVLPKWVTGGILRTRRQEASFASVARIMADAPTLVLPNEFADDDAA